VDLLTVPPDGTTTIRWIFNHYLSLRKLSVQMAIKSKMMASWISIFFPAPMKPSFPMRYSKSHSKKNAANKQHRE